MMPLSTQMSSSVPKTRPTKRHFLASILPNGFLDATLRGTPSCLFSLFSLINISASDNDFPRFCCGNRALFKARPPLGMQVLYHNFAKNASLRP